MSSHFVYLCSCMSNAYFIISVYSWTEGQHNSLSITGLWQTYSYWTRVHWENPKEQSFVWEHSTVLHKFTGIVSTYSQHPVQRGLLTPARPVFLLQCYRLSLFKVTSTALPKVLFWWSIPWIAGNWLLAGSSREATRQCHTWAGFSLTWFARGWSVKHFNRSLTDE